MEETQELFTCPECGKEYKTEAGLAKHKCDVKADEEVVEDDVQEAPESETEETHDTESENTAETDEPKDVDEENSETNDNQPEDETPEETKSPVEPSDDTDPSGRLFQKAKKLRDAIRSCKDAETKHNMEKDLKRIEQLLEGE